MSSNRTYFVFLGHVYTLEDGLDTPSTLMTSCISFLLPNNKLPQI